MAIGEESSVVVPEEETFQDFMVKWTTQLRKHLDDLVAAILSNSSADHTGLVKGVVDHYEEFFQVKSCWGKQDILRMFNPTWVSPLERALSWIAGWRPTVALHLVYTLSGFQLGEVTHGLTTADTVELSTGQLAQVEELRRRTVEEERKISEEMGEQQENVEFINEERVDSVLKEKEEGLERILKHADELRMRTLKGIVDILTPSQAVRFLVAFAEFQLGMNDWVRQIEINMQGRGIRVV